jgi:hypothetical protein
LFGVLLSAGRLHRPVDRQSRALVGQLGMLILINLAFGFASGGSIDNAAHIGGLVAGLWLGALVLPTGVPTLSSFWQRPSLGPAPAPSQPSGPPSAYTAAIGIGVVAVVVAVGIAIGTSEREARRGASEPADATAAIVLSLPVGSSAARR